MDGMGEIQPAKVEKIALVGFLGEGRMICGSIKITVLYGASDYWSL